MPEGIRCVRYMIIQFYAKDRERREGLAQDGDGDKWMEIIKIQ